MRTTIEIEDGLYRKAKAEAARRQTSLKNLMDEALRAFLAGAKRGLRYRADLPVVRGKHPPAIDPADRNALFDFLDKKP